MAGEYERTLETTPTWAVATVCFFLIFVSILIEYLLHLIAKYFTKKRRKALLQALDKTKSELMLLGFISLFLTASEKSIAEICIPKSVGETFLPCGSLNLDEEGEETKCAEQDKVSLMSRKGAQQLQYLIFVLAVYHVFSSVLTFGLGMAKMRRWESWEAETKTLEYQFSNDPRRFKLIHQTSFGKRHLKCWSDLPILLWLVSFLRQFYNSVSKVDYLILRHGFITAHLSEGSDFDFQKYIKRALEKDFGVVVGISWWIWIFAMLFLFFNAQGFHNYLWLPFIPLVMLLVVGTKLQGIITNMSLDSHDKSQVVRGTFLVRPSDHYFWFGRPELLLHLMHFTLFQNSFQLAFFTWTWSKFGFKSCFHDETHHNVVRLTVGVIIQFLCGYVTLPLYALVTQMGTSMRRAVFTEGVVQGLKKWRRKARKNVASRNTATWPEGRRRPSFDAPSFDASLETNSLGTSPSFGTLDASFSIDADDSVAVEIMEEDDDHSIREIIEESSEERPQNISSFDGFRMSNIYSHSD